MSKDLTRLDRISALLVQLQSRPIVKSSDMAERFGVSQRTIYRDMRTLSEAGVPICGNSGVGYSLVDGYRLPSLMFTKEEAIAFLTAEKIIEQLTDTQNSNYFRQGMDKIRAALRAVDKKYLHDMDDTIAVYKSRNVGESLPNSMQVILASINEKLMIEIDYTDAEENTSKRTLEAVGITYSYPRWYLSAWCHLRREYIVMQVEVTMAEYGEAWEKVYAVVQEKGYECDMRDHYELYVSCVGDVQDANAPWIVDLCIPVK